MVTFSFYESDNRVMRYAEALAARGDQVAVLALRRSPDLPREETLNGVQVFRLRDRFDKSGRSKLGHLLPVLGFLRVARRWIRRRHSAHPYDLFHIHNMPDFLVFAASYPKRKGAKVILDIHDLVPELYESKFGDSEGGGGLGQKALLWMEKVSARFADHIIVANHLWIDRYAERTGAADRCTAIINHVDSSVFKPVSHNGNGGRKVVIFPGGLQWHQGVDIAIDAFRRVRAEIPAAEFHIYGDGVARSALERQARELGLDDSVRFFEPRPLREIAKVMAAADLGVVPKRADSFGNEAYSTKIMEFMSVGVPVVISSTKIDRHYFDDSVVRFFESGNSEALAEAMIEVLASEKLRSGLVESAFRYAAANSWQSRRQEYLDLVDTVCRIS